MEGIEVFYLMARLQYFIQLKYHGIAGSMIEKVVNLQQPGFGGGSWTQIKQYDWHRSKTGREKRQNTGSSEWVDRLFLREYWRSKCVKRIGRLWEQKRTSEDDNLIEQKCVDVCLKMGRILFFVLGFLVAENIQFFNQ